MPADAAKYAELVRECTRLLEGNSSEQQQLELQASAVAEDVFEAREAHTEIERDMQGLRSSRSSCPRDLLAARAMIPRTPDCPRTRFALPASCSRSKHPTPNGPAPSNACCARWRW